MAKQREDIEAEDQEPGQQTETEQQHDEQPDVEVVEKDGKTEVRTTGESRRERRDRERREERQREIDAVVNPLREQLTASQRMLQEVMGRFAQQPQVQQQQQPQMSESKKKFRDIVSRQEALIERIRREGPRMSEDGRQRLKDEYYDLEEEKVSIKADAIAQERISKFRPPEQPSPYVQRLQMDHPDVWQNERARNYAAQVSMARIAELEAAGTPPTPADVQKIHNESFLRAGEVFLGRRRGPAPTPSGQRERFAGTPSSGRSSGGPMSRQLTKEERELAVATRQENETEEQAIARWTKTAVANGLWER